MSPNPLHKACVSVLPVSPFSFAALWFQEYIGMRVTESASSLKYKISEWSTRVQLSGIMMSLYPTHANVHT